MQIDTDVALNLNMMDGLQRIKSLNLNHIQPEEVTWSDGDIHAIQFALLVQSLTELNDRRRSRKMRGEAWEWLFSDSTQPFSSSMCAQSHNLSIEILRQRVKKYVSFS